MLDICSVVGDSVPMKREHDVSESFERLMALFENELKGVAFPLVDIEILRASARRCTEEQRALVEAEAALASARQQLQAAESELSALTLKAIAYVGIYAADDPELRAKVDAIHPKKRGGGKRGGGARAKATPRSEPVGPSKSEPTPAVSGIKKAS